MSLLDFKSWTLFMACACAGTSVQAFQPLVTDDTATQGEGRHQLEWSYTREGERAQGQASRLHAHSVVYTYGLQERLDLYAGGVWLDVSGRRGWGNPVLGAKWRFHETDHTHWAVKSEMAWPVSVARERQDLGTGRSSGAVTLILSQEMPFGALHVNAGLGVDRFREAAGHSTRFSRFSGAPVWDVTPDFKLTLDLGQERARVAADTVRTRFVQVGLIWALREDLDWAAGWLSSQNKAAQKTRLKAFTTGLTWRF